MKKHLKKVEELFRTALNVKLKHEDVLSKLVRNPITKSITKYLLSEVPKKEFDIAELS